MMADTYHADTQNQAKNADFSSQLSLAIRAQYSAANAAPGPRIKKELLDCAARLEALQRAFGVRMKVARTARKARA